MEKDQSNHETEYDLDQLLRKSFGCDDDHLLEQMRQAQICINDSQIPPEPEDGFSRLVEDIGKRGLKPRYQEEMAEQALHGDENRKIRRLGPFFRVALAAVILGSVLMATSIPGGAKKSYEYSQSARENSRNDAAMNNEKNKQASGSLEEAYKKIHEQIGINVLKLRYKPQDMEYLHTAVNYRHATISLNYKGRYFYMTQQLRNSDNSANHLSDRENYDKVYNEWLDKDIIIEKAVTENGEEEFSAQIVEDNAYYYLSGIISETEFKKIVSQLFY